MSGPLRAPSVPPRLATPQAACEDARRWEGLGHALEALRVLEWANQRWPEDALVAAHYAVLLVQERGQARRALEIVATASRTSPGDADVQWCAARVLLATGERGACVDHLRAAVARFPSHRQLGAMLDTVGLRRPPAFPRLPRSHPVNKFLGLLTWRLGFR
ncbi:MAG: hypothetical protein HY904_17395 [Deltaproteobacteria bacterium]|nr:hypothetical protein [Deltaproteobacteria bacterium]